MLHIMKRLYVNLDEDLELRLNAYLNTHGNHYGLRAEVLRRALHEYLEKERANELRSRPIRILER